MKGPTLRVRRCSWLLWRLTNFLRPSIALLVIQAHRVLLKRAKNADQIAWTHQVMETMQRWGRELDALTNDGLAVCAGEELPRKITRRARKRGPTLFAVFMIYTFLGITIHAQDWSTIHVDEHLVRLLIVSPDDSSSAICTGVIVNEHEGYVVAAAHCVPTASSASIAAEKKHAEKVVVNYALDVAVLKVKGLKGKAAHLRTSAASVGTPITLAGYGFGAQRLKHVYGWLSDTEDETVLAANLLVDANAIAGMSGGGMFDQAGELVTIVGGVIVSAKIGRLTYGPTPDVLADFLKPYLKEPKP